MLLREGSVEGKASLRLCCHLSLPRAISSILGFWLDQYPEDFFQPPEFPCLLMLLAYLQLNFPGSDWSSRPSFSIHSWNTWSPLRQRQRVRRTRDGWCG